MGANPPAGNALRGFLETHPLVTLASVVVVVASAVAGVFAFLAKSSVALKERELELTYTQKSQKLEDEYKAKADLLEVERLRLQSRPTEGEPIRLFDQVALGAKYQCYPDRHFAVPSDVSTPGWEWIDTDEWALMVELSGGGTSEQKDLSRLKEPLSKSRVKVLRKQTLDQYTYRGAKFAVRAQCLFYFIPWELLQELTHEVRALVSEEMINDQISVRELLNKRTAGRLRMLEPAPTEEKDEFLRFLLKNGGEQYVAFCLQSLSTENAQLARELQGRIASLVSPERRDRFTMLITSKCEDPDLVELRGDLAALKERRAEASREVTESADNTVLFRKQFIEGFQSTVPRIRGVDSELTDIAFADQRFQLAGVTRFENAKGPSGQPVALSVYRATTVYRTAWGVVKVAYLIPYRGSEDKADLGIANSMRDGFRVIK